MKQPQITKLAFHVIDDKIYEKEYTFDFFGGFSMSQKQKTIEAFHLKIESMGITQILEISRKSKDPLGNALSAFNLMLTIDGNKYPLECVYQSSKVFNHNVQFTEALKLTPLEAKKLIKEEVELKKLVLTGFNCFGINFPLIPTTLFYDYIYVMALFQNTDIASGVIRYKCFTDVEFNHKKQFASQARSCAIYKYLSDQNKVTEVLEDINQFIDIYSIGIIPHSLSLII